MPDTTVAPPPVPIRKFSRKPQSSSDDRFSRASAQKTANGGVPNRAEAQKSFRQSASGGKRPGSPREKPEPKILHQSYFKSVGPRTYAAQVKQAGTGNHFLVLTEGKRDDKSDELRKTRLFVFSEDFPAFFRMLHETAQFIRANPVPSEVKQRQAKFWAKRNKSAADPTTTGESNKKGDGTADERR